MFKKIPGGGPGLGARTRDDGEASSPPTLASKYATTKAVIDLLCQTWPRTFFKYEKRRRSLALNIAHDIFLLLDGAVTYPELKRALGCYTSNVGYLKSCRAGVPRMDIDGMPCGEVTKEEAEYCWRKLNSRNNGSGRAGAKS
jgi:ProP effector